jgi:DNA polymerase-3 subunit gamma/tau
MERDAASHGGVDHARDLRERATFAPVRDRYKIFIIDEAHMVTREGFNALLKIVEEPPEHIKFIFATTEPSKVLTTIRSRTHHYPFRLVPPEPLMHYLEQLCAEEHVAVAPGVLSLVVRAGGGSVRDTLSVLDQLMAGSDEQGITYDLAVALLGYTHGALLDDVVDAFASGDAATVFRAVDRVVQTGQDPRRFVEDLLQRFRDLIIVNAVPESAGNILHGMPQDQVSRLRNQASQLGAAELSRAADITNTALTEMTGATSPQLHLELLCARVLLPSSEDTTRGVTARVDRIERRLSIARGTAPAAGHEEPAGAAPVVAAPSDAGPSAALPAAPEPVPAPAAPAPEAAASGRPAEPSAEPRQADRPRPAAEAERPAAARGPEPSRQTEEPRRPEERGTGPARPAEQPPRQDTPRAPGPAGNEIELLRASWPEIVNALADIRRVAWFTVQRGTPQSFDGRVLRIMFDAEGDLMNFPRFEDDLRRAVHQVLGIDCRAEAVPPGGGHGRGGAPRAPEPSAPPAGRGPEPRTDAPDRGPQGRSEPHRRERDGGDHERRDQDRGDQEPGHEGPQGRARQEPRTPAPERQERRPVPTGGPGAPAGVPDGEGQDAWSAHGRPVTDAAPEWTDPAWAEEPVHSWSVAAIPQAGDAGAPAPPVEPAARAASPERTAPRTPPAPSASRPEPVRAAPRDPAVPATRAGSSGSGPARAAAGPQDRDVPPPFDDVPPPEEPPYPDDEPPYPDGPADLDEAPPEQWRPSPPARQDPAPAAAAPAQPSAPPTAEARPGAARAGTTAGPTAGTASATTARPTVVEAAEDAAARQRLSFRERHAAQIAAGRQAPGRPAPEQDDGVEWDDSFVPSSDDEALEDSTLYGRAAIERILGGMLIEERDLHTGE